MASAFTIRKSIHGRLLALSSTGGIVSAASPGSTSGTHLTDGGVNACAQMWGPGMFTQATGPGVTINNYGITQITTDSTAGSTWFVAAPVKGVYKTINLISTSSGTLSANTAGVVFVTNTLAGSSVLGLNSTIGAMISVGLQGMSTLRWFVTGLRSNSSLALGV